MKIQNKFIKLMKVISIIAAILIMNSVTLCASIRGVKDNSNLIREQADFVNFD